MGFQTRLGGDSFYAVRTLRKLKGQVQNITYRNDMVRRYQPDASIDGASIAFFRMMLGVILIFFAYDTLGSGNFYLYYLSPEYHFKYPGFDWIDLTNDQLKLCLFALMMTGFCLALGLFYRLAALVSFLAFTAFFLFERAEYCAVRARSTHLAS